MGARRLPMSRLLVAVLVLVPQVAAGKAGIVYSTGFDNNEIVYGCPITYSLTGLAGDVDSYTWEYKAECMVDYTDTSTSNHLDREWTIEVIPGKYKIRCKIIYSPTDDDRPEPESPVLDIAIPPPDGTRIVQ